MGTLRGGRVSFAKVKSFPLRKKTERSLTDELKSFAFSFSRLDPLWEQTVGNDIDNDDDNDNDDDDDNDDDNDNEKVNKQTNETIKSDRARKKSGPNR